jgi:hypothetical protein
MIICAMYVTVVILLSAYQTINVISISVQSFLSSGDDHTCRAYGQKRVTADLQSHKLSGIIHFIKLSITYWTDRNP